MANFEALGIMTDEGRARLAEMIATGKSFKVDRYVVGDQGHDSTDPTLAITPDPSRTGCYCSSESITVSGGCVFEDLIDGVSYASSTCPIFEVVLEKGEATGVVSSICLLGTITYSPNPLDPEIGTQFLFAIVNFPLKTKIPEEKYTYNISVQY